MNKAVQGDHIGIFEELTEHRAGGGKYTCFDGNEASAIPPLVFSNYAVPTFSSYSEAFSTIPGGNVSQGRGLADYSNRGFFSAGKNLGNTEYALPSNNPADYSRQTVTDPNPCLPSGRQAEILRGAVPDLVGGSNTNVALTSRGLWDVPGYTIPREEARYSMNETAYYENADLLVTRAASYSAGIIDYFFRGKMDLVKDPQNSAQYIIRNLGSEEMEGTFALYYDDADGIRYPVPGASWQLILPPGQDSASVSFTTPTDPAPTNSIYYLVFNGRMGNEIPSTNSVGAVAVKVGSFVSGWSAPVAVGVTPYAYWGSVELDANGNAMVVYQTYDSASQTDSLWSRRYTPGGGWGEAVLIATNDAWLSFDSLAVNADGNAMVVYSVDSGHGQNDLWSQRYTPGSGWGDAMLITRDDTPLYYGSIVMDAGGNAMLVYETYDSASQTGSLWSRRYTLDSGWGGAMLITSIVGLSYNSLAMDPNGNAMVVYSTIDYASWTDGLWSRRYTPGGGWGGAVLIASNHLNNRYFNYYDSLGMDADGNAMLAYSVSDDADQWSLRSQRYTSDGGWEGAIHIASSDYGALSMGADGNAIVVYMNASGRAVARHYVPEVGWSDEIQLSGFDQSVPGFVWSIDVEADGNAVVVGDYLPGGLWSNFYTP